MKSQQCEKIFAKKVFTTLKFLVVTSGRKDINKLNNQPTNQPV